MKKKGHPPYREVLFVDTATGTKFVCGTTLDSKETEEFEGKQYPVYRVPISSASHPFFTGSQQFVDSEGRVDKFRKRYARKGVKPSAPLGSDPTPTQAGPTQVGPDQAGKKKETNAPSKSAPGKQNKMKKNGPEQ